MTQDTSNRHSFILRIWRAGENQEWKCWVQHADSGESSSLIILSDLLPFIEKYIGAPDESTSEKHTQQVSNKRTGLK
jgi:hypothetical protein